ncbi:ATP-binding protein [Polyangium mundeleinium]|uniref:ATP-binding protein n=1 Tax=Polyangium mundeleinium TaxID=2995306 RepID=A0ABT5ESP8_9BACT|nr:ATP-binding protein [Polyangium mundeleinium]MDC0744840.1 ATP-binding protein [Polyangium mundeleinium]
MASVAVVRERLRLFAERAGAPSTPAADGGSLDLLERAREQARNELSTPAAIERIAAAFELSSFERDILLLCVGVELDPGLAGYCALLQGDRSRARPTFEVALSALPDAHWSALTPERPLRRYRLIEIMAGPTLTTSPLGVSERILHSLVGIDQLDERLGLLLAPELGPRALAPTHRALAADIVQLWSRDAPSSWPVVALSGEERSGKLGVATSAAAAQGLTLHVLHAADLPSSHAERDELLRLWEREARLSPSALFLDCEEMEAPGALRIALSFADRCWGAVFLASRFPARLERRAVTSFEVSKLGATEQRLVWREALGPAAEVLEGHLDTLVASFNLGAGSIQTLGHQVSAHFESEGAEGLAVRLWESCRARARPRLDDLAQRIPSTAGWDDLVLAHDELDTLRTLAAQARQRYRVYESWGFGEKSARGLGIGVLFAGVSGTGKTMAAEILSRELGLDLVRVDLSQVVSKYIGETEKNLSRIFDAAGEGGALLLFDEADALFGKRSEVKDSHDRYANIEVSYLLQRMEAYQGLAILTTNMKNALDTAFLRRLRFVVTFPFPDAQQRAEIWRRVFPRKTPTEGLDWQKLARLSVTGGNIRNIAVNAAFLAADAGDPVRMEHLRRAASAECLKLEKPALVAEIAGWA